MSKAVVPIPVIAVEDPVTKLGRPEAFGVSQGGIVYTYQQIVSQVPAGTVPSTITIVAPPPSPDIVVDRRVYLMMTWKVEPTGVYSASGPTPFAAKYDAPRAFPSMQALQSVSAVINNNTITQQYDPIIALMNYNLPRELQQYDYSGAPNYFDQFPDYGTAVGSAVHPLVDASYNPYQMPRGGMPVTYADNANKTPGTAFGPNTANHPSATFTTIEPFFMTPFEQYGECPGFFGVQTLNISLQFTPTGLQRVWSHAYGGVTTNGAYGQTQSITGQGGLYWSDVKVSLAASPSLLFRYITPSPIKVMPSVMEYQYSQLNLYLTATAGSTPPPTAGVLPTSVQGQDVQCNSIQFNTIPDQIFIYLFRNLADRDFSTSDTFGVINSINVDFMNQTGLLNSATQWDLYNMSRKNGYVGTFNQWAGSLVPLAGIGNYSPSAPAGIPCSGLRGSVLCIKPGLDLGLEPSIAPSMNGLYNFKVKVNWWNPCMGWNQAAMVAGGGAMPTGTNSAFNTNYSLYVVTITSGLVTVKDNGTVTQTGLLTRSDVLRAQAAPAMDQGEAQKMVGSGFFENIKRFMGRGGRGYVHRMLGGLFGGSSDAQAAQYAQQQQQQQQQQQAEAAPCAMPAPSSVGSGYESPDYAMGGSHKRKEMASAFEDPRERALAPHLRGRGYDPVISGGSPSSPCDSDFYENPAAGGYGIDPDDRYVREPPLRDQRSPAERYDSAMPEIPPERITRRRAQTLDDVQWEDERRDTPDGRLPPVTPRTRHVFRS